MLITELKWVMDNRDKLDNEDYKILKSMDVFSQYDNGELEQSALKMLEVLSLVNYLYKKYNNL